MAYPKIKINEPQPVPCEDCGFEGYQYSDRLKVWYTTHHDSDGKHISGTYSDSATTVTKGITPYCLNCSKKLKFKLIRLNTEEV